MDELDFSTPPPARPDAAARPAVQVAAQSPLYVPAVALEFFRATGTVEQIPAAKAIFNEGDAYSGLFSKNARMYLLFEGEVGLMLKRQYFGVVKPGEIFGELAVIAGLPRSATAMAKMNCVVISLDEKQFHAALQKKPDFALMLMLIMVNRLRQSIAKLAGAGSATGSAADRGGALDKKMLTELAQELGVEEPTPFAAGRTIVSAGAAGASMYVIVEGRVTISVNNQVVERLGPGGIFGEVALVDRAPRTATATAETNCALLSIGRNDFLELVKKKPAFGASLLKSLAERMQHLAAQTK